MVLLLGVVFKTHVLCISSNFLLHEMSHKKVCLKNVVKNCWWHMEKIIYWENYQVTQYKILCQVFKEK